MVPVKVAISGQPGTGKTKTVLRIAKMVEEKFSIGGFTTHPIEENGEIVGYNLKNFITQEEELSASVRWDVKPKVPGRSPESAPLGIRLDAVNRIATASVQKAIEESDLILVDEVGKLVSESKEFSAVLKLAGVEGGLENNVFKGKAKIFDGEQKLLKSLQETPNQFENLDMITSNVDLSGLEVETADDSNRAFILKTKLAAYLNNSRGQYDYVLIDCPPSLSLLTVMALVSSNSLLVPLQTEFFALEGLTQLMKTIERIKVSLNPDLKIRGILLTMYDKRNKLSSQVEKEARDYFSEKVYSTVIPRNVRLSEAPSHGMPVLIYDKTCPGSKSYFSFTDEFMSQERTIGSAA